MSLQLVCINYGDFKDAMKVISHCMHEHPFFRKITLFHPNPPEPDYEKNKEGWPVSKVIKEFLEDGWIDFTIAKAKSKTQNECCMYEMPQYITCDHVIGVQWDGFITNPSAWTDEFLEYDYIAPPWPLTNIVNPDWRVGSGGFMMASKRMVQLWPTLCEPHPFPNDWSTGAVHRDRFEAAGMKYAPLELAMRFGEEIPLDDQPKVESFGMHGFQYGDHEKYRSLVYA